MNQKFKVYLAGPITGLTYENAQDWREYVSQRIDPQIACYSPLRGKEYFKNMGNIRADVQYDLHPLSTDAGIVTRDRFDCMGSDLVIFNLLGAKQVSIGTMIEFGWADASRSPMITVIEKTGNVHDHAMVRALSAYRVDNLDSAIALAEIVLLDRKRVQ